jgi:acetolactate synthase-1/2/3 large subunit
MVEKGNQIVYGRTPAYHTSPLDVCTVARGLGATVLRIESRGQLRRAQDVLRSVKGPVVIDVQLDPDISLPKNGRIAALAKVSSAVVPARPVLPVVPPPVRIVN